MSATCFISSSAYAAATVLFAFIILSSSVSDACFIRNCPKGGKRSMDSVMMPKRECMKCGPGDLGQCIGPSICCSHHFGCYLGTAETAKCQEENQNGTPCFVTGNVCGADDSGTCVADGVCCDSKSCAVNERCRHKDDTIPENQDKTSRADILQQLIEKLLQGNRQYD